MSFSTITSATGTEYVDNIGISVQTLPTLTDSRLRAFGGEGLNPVALGGFVSAAVNNDQVVKPMKGWIEYASAGSARPASGMLYPRGSG